MPGPGQMSLTSAFAQVRGRPDDEATSQQVHIKPLAATTGHGQLSLLVKQLLPLYRSLCHRGSGVSQMQNNVYLEQALRVTISLMP